MSAHNFDTNMKLDESFKKHLTGLLAKNILDIVFKRSHDELNAITLLALVKVLDHAGLYDYVYELGRHANRPLNAAEAANAREVIEGFRVFAGEKKGG